MFAPRTPPPSGPGVVVVFSAGRAVCMPLRLAGRSLVLGRQCPDELFIDDLLVSRQHVEISVDGSVDGTRDGTRDETRDETVWRVRDLGSLNGTRVDGRAVTGSVSCDAPPVVRFGRTLAIAVDDVSPFFTCLPMRSGRFVFGPMWRAALARAEAVAASGSDLLLVGEKGSGKETAATHFHARGRHANGPLVRVHCAAISHGLAERLFFGTARGSHSDAPLESRGYVHAAEGGVLLLHEVGELEPELQTKLLGLLETRQTPLFGAPLARPVDLSICFAADGDLAPLVAAGRFREDLWRRMTPSAVTLPSLRERREQIPWLAELALEEEAPAVSLEVDLVEACMLRRWRGNIRELLSEIRRIARLARSQSRATVRSDLLAPDPHAARESRPRVTAEQVERALREAPSVSGAAQMLHIHRSHLYRLIRQFGIDLHSVSSAP